MKQFRRILISCIAVVVTLLTASLCLSSESIKEIPKVNKVVNVALNIPLTGPFGIYGQSIRDGALLALDDLSAQDSNIKLNLDFQDNLGQPKTAVSVFQQQMLGKPDIYVSGVKPQTMAIFDLVLKKKLPYFVWIFDAFIVEKHQTVFRTWVNYKYEPKKYMQYIAYKNAKRVAIACVNMPHSKEEFEKILIPELKAKGIKTYMEIYNWDTTDYRSIITKLHYDKPDLYILNGFQENLVGLVMALRDYNLVKNGNVIGTYDLLDAAKVLNKKYLEGLRVIAPAFIIERPSKYEEWAERFKKKYNREPLYTDAYSYEMVMIIANAAQRLSFPATHEQWIKALEKTNMEGVIGHLSFDKGRDLKLDLKIGRYNNNGILKLDQSEQKINE